jgi:hypothetical protein
MKYIVVVFSMLLSAQAFADSFYLVEPMICKGKRFGAQQASDDYAQLVIRFTSFRSTRRDGTLANSLQVETFYFAPDEDTTIDADSAGERWHLSPLRRDGSRVYHPSLSGRDDRLELRILESSRRQGAVTHTLVGQYIVSGSVVGDYAYKLSCVARVVKTPSRVDDYTR